MSGDYTRWDDYFWPDAPGVLRNTLGIRDARLLGFVESQLSAVRIAECVYRPPAGKLDYTYYREVHRRIFVNQARDENKQPWFFALATQSKLDPAVIATHTRRRVAFVARAT